MWERLKGCIWCIYTSWGNAGPHGNHDIIVMSFNPEDMLLISANKLSSVLREVENRQLAVETVVSGHDNVAGKIVVHTGDCMPTSQDLTKMKGAVDVFPEVRQLYSSAAAPDVHVMICNRAKATWSC